MKILFYAHSSTSYGANRSLAEMIQALKNFDEHIQAKLVIPANGPVEEELESLNIDYEVIPHYNWFYNKNLADSWSKSHEISGKLWLLKNKWQKRLLNSLSKKKHIRLIESFNPDLIYVNSSLSPMGAYMAHHFGIKFVWHHRETVEDPITGYYLDSVKEFIKYYNRAKIHFYSSGFLQDYYQNYFGSVPSLNVKNAVCRSEFLQLSKSFNPNKIRFGIVGRINHQKNPFQVISVFKKILNEKSDFKHELHVYGGGDRTMIEKISAQGIPNLHYHEFTSREKVYGDMDFLIINSKNEAFGRVVVEANHAGVPVIARSSGALPELIEVDRNGWMFRSEVELQAILEDINRNISKEKYQELSDSSKKLASANFGLYDHIKLVHDTINSIN